MTAAVAEMLEDLRAAVDRLATTASAMPAYVDDDTLHQLVAPHMGRDSFRSALRAQERKGFPQVNSLWRGRYWPAVKAWLDSENGVRSNAPIATAEDGPEDFDAAPSRKKTGLQDRTQQPPVLDRKPGGSRHPGLPGQVHTFAGRRR